MANSDAFYADNDVTELLKQACKKRGDKSRIINTAVREHFNPEIKESMKVRIKI